MKDLFYYSIKGKKPTHTIKKNTKYNYIDEIGTFTIVENCIVFTTDTGRFEQTPTDFRAQCRSTGHPVEVQ